MNKNETKNIMLIALGGVFYYFLSFLGHKTLFVNLIVFLIICVAVLFLAIRKFELAVGLALLELMLSSFGRMFYLEIWGTQITLRLAIFVIVVGVWIGRQLAANSQQLTARRIWYYFPLFAAILWGIGRGFLQDNSFDNIFADANGFLFFGYLGPAIFAAKKAGWGRARQVFAGGTIALWLITMFSAVGFSYGLFEIGDGFYKWIRDARLGEVTFVNAQFSRVFVQSHIFALLGFFLFGYKVGSKTENIFYLILAILSASMIWVGLSRSFWVGWIVGILILFYYFFAKRRKTFSNSREWFLLILAVVSGFILSALILPSLPKTVFVRGTASAEPAANARRLLLPPLIQEIKKNPVLGSGFGTTLTYKTTDPRAREKNPSGEIATFAFEWGWLDIWLKMGLLGVLAYLWLIFCVLKRLYKASEENKPLAYGLFAAIIALVVTHTFSPYLNHPLGIGLLLFVDAHANLYQQNVL